MKEQQLFAANATTGLISDYNNRERMDRFVKDESDDEEDIKAALDKKMAAQMRGVAMKAYEELAERLENGDERALPNGRRATRHVGLPLQEGRSLLALARQGQHAHRPLLCKHADGEDGRLAPVRLEAVRGRQNSRRQSEAPARLLLRHPRPQFLRRQVRHARAQEAVHGRAVYHQSRLRD